MMQAEAWIIEEAFRHWARGEPVLMSFSGFLQICHDCGLISNGPNDIARREIESHFYLALEATGNNYTSSLDLRMTGFLHALLALADSVAQHDEDESEEPTSANDIKKFTTGYMAQRLGVFLQEKLKPALALHPEKRWP